MEEKKEKKTRTKRSKMPSLIKYGALDKTVVKKPQKDYAPMLEGPATNKLDMAHSRQLTFEDISNEAIIENNGLTITFTKYKELKGLRPSTQKLFDMGVLELTKVNNFKEDKNINTEIKFSLKDYAGLLGNDMEIRLIDDPEKQKKEKKRVQKIIDKVRTKVNEDLEVLYDMSLDWEEEIKGKQGDYKKVRILQDFSLERGIVTMNFSEKIARYLNTSYITQYPKKLLTLDERVPLVIQLGRKLASHYWITNNQKRGSNNKIQVKTLIKGIGSLLSFEEVQKTDPGHWERRIREPLENALDILERKGILKSWELCNSKGTPLTNKQVEANDYKTYSECYIKFELK